MIECVGFLREVSLGKKMKLGDKVAIIGGGNAATDSARTALRLGAKEVSIFYRRTRAEMPADLEEVHAALAEGVQIYYLAAPTKVITQNGKVSLECTRMRLGAPDSSGRRRPVPINDSEFTTDFDTIIAAIGQSPEVPRQFNLTTGRGGVIEVNADTLATAQKGIYAGGDVVSGPASVIEAIAAGRKAAISIDKYLGGKGNIDETLAPPENTAALVEEPEKKPHPEMPVLPVEQRVCGFRQIELGYPEKLAVEEAARCFRCDLDQPD